ncbi:bifunctional (p)ppGpp synthetase/guanosine-3',5'-bis(diphosphate) 3'-pyrophosphohydrolase [Chitinispirillales bacterium ANBcel5]|uniref:RelA/SpoT family protein n=1 Tax=Cellulosispirillum alkaliphilum TaxID=3039283 RepID=UPI002A4F4FC7|nr:bifunctional (p)ppGpp synthetase/guanosine-3',5'-bis(diphosphate) 3'-pyrophosphohydrolase [Chitinispirillales bacterium ANBcel5]
MDSGLFLPSASLDQTCELFLSKIKEVNPKVHTELIEKAFRFSWEAHKDQLRKSGEPFLAHPAAVSLILAEQRLDSVTISAGLLHDVLEDTTIKKETLAEEFGDEIALLVDGVTKISTFQLKSRQERQAETYRKMLLSMAKDLRVIIIKFADRLHNLRTLKYLEPDRIRAIATETLDIYAPLAHRLGMAKIKWELEDLAFKHLYPEEYKDIVAKVVANRVERESLIDNFTFPLRRRLEEEGIEATIVGRPKHFYSIYRKMVQRNKPFEEIFDLLALRVITKSIRDCYHVLGIIHSLWTPVQERFKDYISTPKSNGYQSLHTTVYGEQGHIVELQIRTWEMNQVAEDGIAAHWLYKSGSKEMSRDDKALVWLKNLIEWQKDLTDSTEFYEFFKIDLFHAEIFVFTPNGDLISLPKGATVLDFAFSVHTQLGLHCIGAKIDGKIEPINKQLKSGQTVEILHLNSKSPSINWLREVKTPKARSAIRRWLKNTGKQESIDLGKKIVHTSYKKLHSTTSFNDHTPGLLQFLGLINLDRLYELVGNGELPISRVMQYFKVRKVKKSVPSNMVSRLMGTFTGRNQGILVGGNDNLMIRFAKCCNPIPGDPIVGFVTRGRGISVHRDDCANVEFFSADPERKIDVRWDEGEQKKYHVSLEVVGGDRPGLLHEISQVYSEFGANVLEGSIKTISQQARSKFRIEIRNRNQLKQIFRRLQRIKGIENVTRVKDYINYPQDSSQQRE